MALSLVECKLARVFASETVLRHRLTREGGELNIDTAQRWEAVFCGTLQDSCGATLIRAVSVLLAVLISQESVMPEKALRTLGVMLSLLSLLRGVGRVARTSHPPWTSSPSFAGDIITSSNVMGFPSEACSASRSATVGRRVGVLSRRPSGAYSLSL